jgi:protein-tyrosine-phosphatase
VPAILFLCVKNSARSQLAEGLARALAPAGYRFWSAGSDPGQLNPLAIAALAEQQIDISSHRAKGLADVPLEDIDTIVTLCAEEVCPVVPGQVRRLHWPLPDPKDLPSFRTVRDELRRRLPALWGAAQGLP